MLSLGSSSSFQTALISLSKTSYNIASLSKKLSSGKSINTGKDGPSLISKISALTASINGYGIANNNISSTSGMLSTAEGGLSQMMSSLQQLREVAIQSADGTISAQDRSVLTNRASDLMSSIDSVATGANFNGVNLLDGSFTNKSVQVGPNSGDTVKVSMADVRTSTLNINSIDLSSQASSGNAITAIDNAINQVTSAMASVGSSQNQMDNIYGANETSFQSLSQARSNIEDLDFGAAVALKIQLQIKQQAQILVLSKSINTEKGKLSLLA